MEMPQTISHADTRANRYENETLTTDVLGAADGLFYSMSPGGKITCDMGESTRVGNGEGTDFIVRSGTGSDDQVTVLIAADQDDQFVEVANDSGDIEVDIAGSGLEEIRYIKLVDDGDGEFNSENPGYDLDAIENLAPIFDEDTDEDDTDEDDTDEDDTDEDDTDSESDSGDDDDDSSDDDDDSSDDDDDDDDDNDDNSEYWKDPDCGCASVGLNRGTPNSLLDLYLF
jgi:hypothetical protein